MKLTKTLAAALTALAAVAAPAAAQDAETTVVASPGTAPFQLVGTSFSLGTAVAKGERLPTGASLVLGRVVVSRQAPNQSVVLRCPAGQRIVDTAAGFSSRNARAVLDLVRPDRSTSLAMIATFAGTDDRPASSVRAVVCLDEQRIARLRARQDREHLARLAEKRPEVRRARRAQVCRAADATEEPGRLYVGALRRGDGVLVLRRSGRYAEVTGRGSARFRNIGWIRSADLCR